MKYAGLREMVAAEATEKGCTRYTRRMAAFELFALHSTDEWQWGNGMGWEGKA